MKTKLLTICLLFFYSQVFAECQYRCKGACVTQDEFYDCVRELCAVKSQESKTNYSAKKTYKYCLKNYGVPEESFFDIFK